MPEQLYEYQEQSYLLDPFLERLVVPVVDTVKNSILTTRKGEVLNQLANLLHSYIRSRGYKAISMFPVDFHVSYPSQIIAQPDSFHMRSPICPLCLIFCCSRTDQHENNTNGPYDMCSCYGYH